MKTITKSPKQQLREHFAALHGEVIGRRQGDWCEFHCGDLVFDEADERHIGRVTAIHNSAVATVVWEETKWKSHVPLKHLRRAK